MHPSLVGLGQRHSGRGVKLFIQSYYIVRRRRCTYPPADGPSPCGVARGRSRRHNHRALDRLQLGGHHPEGQQARLIEFVQVSWETRTNEWLMGDGGSTCP